MRQPTSEYSTAELAFATGHKLTKIHRSFISPMIGMVYFAKLDNGPTEQLTRIRKRLELELYQLEQKQGTAVH